MIRAKHLSLILPIVFAACASRQQAVSVVGASSDVTALTGEWVGDYSSTESGRSGSISFNLRHAGDSAFGDVVMVPTGLNRPLAPWRGEAAGMQTQRPEPEVLTISFVRVQSGTVTGRLAPYAEPGTGTRLLTTFEGTLSGNTIEGTYLTRLPSGQTQTGRWRVQRR